MVIVEPYRWIKSTAIKERLDLANKLNEVIDVLNGGVVTIEDIDLIVSSDGVFTFIFTLSDGAVKEMSFDMGNFIDNTVASAISSALTGYVSKTGVSEVTGDIRVPTTPANPLTVVNSVYVNDATTGVNNILHKSGNEVFSGEKVAEGTIAYPRRTKRTNLDITNVTTTDFIGQDVIDKNGVRIASFNQVFRTNGEREQQFTIGDTSYNTALIMTIYSNGNVILKLQKTVNGTTTSTNIATL